jgi:hypothetical protein
MHLVDSASGECWDPSLRIGGEKRLGRYCKRNDDCRFSSRARFSEGMAASRVALDLPNHPWPQNSSKLTMSNWGVLKIESVTLRTTHDRIVAGPVAAPNHQGLSPVFCTYSARTKLNSVHMRTRCQRSDALEPGGHEPLLQNTANFHAEKDFKVVSFGARNASQV